MVARALGRLILVPLGFLFGAIASLAVLVTLGLERATHAMHGRDIDEATIDRLFDLLAGARGLAGVATIVPALIVIVVGEVGRIRSVLYYVAGGGVALVSMPLLMRSGSGDAALAPLGAIWQVLATAGFAGGFVYWLVAGRRA